MTLAARIPNLKERLYITISTLCNFRCRFCASTKTSIPKEVMPNELFFDIVEKAYDFGFSAFNVTPMIGEVLTDPGFLQKLDFLEAHAGVECFSFCTNLSLASAESLHAIRRYQKLQCLAISLYGYDEDSFEKLTRAKPVYFEKMVDQLATIAAWDACDVSRVELRVRTERNFNLEKCTPQLTRIFDLLKKKSARIRIVTDSYSNWGGLITEEDVQGLDLCLKPCVIKPTPCAFLFYKPTVLPNGLLNACSAEDGKASKVIGDLKTQSFYEIYSRQNRRYLEMIDRQIHGDFDPVCQACSGYHNLLEKDYTYQYHQLPFLSMENFFDQLT